MRLNLGCDTCYLVDRGWVDIDINPHAPHVVKADACALPYRDNSADFVFHSHLIEHMTYDKGLALLRECYRVLKPGGRVRVSTPDLKFLARLIMRPRNFDDYLAFQCKNKPHESQSRVCFTVNRFVRDWGHLYIWDYESLHRSMLSVGFRDISSHLVSESDCQELRDLEPVDRLPAGMFQLESFSLEGVK